MLVKNRHIIISAVFACIVASSIVFKFYTEKAYKISEEDKKIVLDTVNVFSQCAGYFDALSWRSEQLGLTETSTSLKNHYRGWHMAGAYLAYSVGAIENWQGALTYTDSLSSAHSQEYKARLETDLESTQKEADLFFEEKCKPFIEYQEQLVMEMREKLASMPASNK